MTQHVPQIKVCGVTRLSDLDVMPAAGVDTVGINLVASSPRYVGRGQAAELCARAAELGLLRVAVLLDPTQGELQGLVECGQYDYLQLHGAELPGLVSGLSVKPSSGPRPSIIKAISWSGRAEQASLAAIWRKYHAQRHSPSGLALRAFLIDAYVPGQAGGTGQTANWGLLKPRPQMLSGIPLILAGGLTPHNIAEAISVSRPDGVDTASGVEDSPGEKSAVLVQQFARAAHTALSTH